MSNNQKLTVAVCKLQLITIPANQAEVVISASYSTTVVHHT